MDATSMYLLGCRVQYSVISTQPDYLDSYLHLFSFSFFLSLAVLYGIYIKKIHKYNITR